MQEGRHCTLLTQHLADRRDLETRADDDEKVDLLAVTVQALVELGVERLPEERDVGLDDTRLASAPLLDVVIVLAVLAIPVSRLGLGFLHARAVLLDRCDLLIALLPASGAVRYPLLHDVLLDRRARYSGLTPKARRGLERSVALEDLLDTGEALESVNVLRVVAQEDAAVFEQLDPSMAWARDKVARINLLSE